MHTACGPFDWRYAAERGEEIIVEGITTTVRSLWEGDGWCYSVSSLVCSDAPIPCARKPTVVKLDVVCAWSAVAGVWPIYYVIFTMHHYSATAHGTVCCGAAALGERFQTSACGGHCSDAELHGTSTHSRGETFCHGSTCAFKLKADTPLVLLFFSVLLASDGCRCCHFAAPHAVTHTHTPFFLR
ncbi:hypothetical protein TraAM80_07591 [Trypanosoma rangeli]|uniref:Uncharacterized protein n=1 Tax=Trypanosoma rangeli TaxID=5698 RepID=A0A422N4M6_TRYRA|nr:uncharacterized protein TraAM80_07591 [Trypanosoma rangeli]RNF00428.1 hypothetical protein TraAM80_07591 [Trypanosoma rangeli]|eukprot:RNF00428.1 hypothetical protein TraAM80_07591 [Trypanosoma rangeli]